MIVASPTMLSYRHILPGALKPRLSDRQWTP
jgi:hypothetical protein